MTTTVDQKAYLQKYLSGPSKDKKKKKKKDKKAIKGKGFKIIDDDLDLSKLRALDRDELDIYGEGEDAPQVAGIIDERPEELRRMEQFATKWKVINQDDGFNSNIKIEEIKQSVKEVEKENEVIFGKMYSDSEDERERDAKKQENDASPPRKNTSKKLTESPQRKKAPNYDSDPSPPRKSDSRKQSDDQKMNSAKKRSDSDASPPRKNSRKQVYSSPSRMSSLKRQNDDSDASPPRKNSSKKHNNDSDASPPRKKASKKNYDSDLSPPRKHSRKDDASPPRKKASKNYGNDASSSRKRDSRKETKDSKRANRQSRWGDFEFEKNEIEMISQEHEKSNRKKSPKRQSDSDISPPRKKDRYTDNKDRRKGNDKKDRTQSRSQKKDSDSDLSPPRKNKKNERYNQSDSDLSPPRKKDMNQKKRNNDSPPPTNKKMAKTLEGKMAGLQDAKQLRQENESFRRREDEVFNKMGDDVSGRNAKAVSRKSKRETSKDRTKQKEKAERQKEIDEKYKKWSRGLKQIEDHQERVAEFMHEASKPLARHQGDSDLEGRLKGVERDGDPMLQYIRERKREKGLLAPEKPSYKGSFPPNRFNIRPGYRWDGVDRSNGYEKKYFDQQSKRKAQEEEAYKWSTEDL